MKVKKKKIITIPALKKKVQVYFNKFVRERDKGNRCISCGKEIKPGQEQAGHLFGTHSYNWMRYNETNCHLECMGCNGLSHDSLIWYTLNLQQKLEPAVFKALIEESKIKKPEFTREELEDLLNKYKK